MEEIRGEDVRILTERTVKKSGKIQEEESGDELIEVRKFVTAPAHASVNLSRTFNLGDFNSVKFGVSVTIPCYKEEMDNGFDEAQTIAMARYKEFKDSVKSAEDAEGVEDGKE